MAWSNIGSSAYDSSDDDMRSPTQASPMRKLKATISQKIKNFSPRKNRKDTGKPPLPPTLPFNDEQEAIPACPLLPLEPTKRRYEIAVVACGCFWSPQRRFQKMKGVKRVIVGYTGGKHPNPSADQMMDHTQALFIEYSRRTTSYRQILEMWLDNDYPWEPEEELQYRSALFVMNQDQHAQAVEFLSELVMSRPNCHLYVDVERATEFYQAEETQQDYMKKQVQAAKEQFLLWANDSASSGLHSITE